MIYPIPAYHLAVNTDYDVVSLRQHVRQQARALGLGLIQQAKLATATTTVARGLLGLHQRTTFVMRTLTEQEPPLFEVSCMARLTPTVQDCAQLDRVLRLDEARLLVDQLDLTPENEQIQITLRVRLDVPAS
jgi:hypothetical protein